VLNDANGELLIAVPVVNLTTIVLPQAAVAVCVTGDHAPESITAPFAVGIVHLYDVIVDAGIEKRILLCPHTLVSTIVAVMAPGTVVATNAPNAALDNCLEAAALFPHPELYTRLTKSVTVAAARFVNLTLIFCEVVDPESITALLPKVVLLNDHTYPVGDALVAVPTVKAGATKRYVLDPQVSTSNTCVIPVAKGADGTFKATNPGLAPP
jgi:hypothetical protein